LKKSLTSLEYPGTLFIASQITGTTTTLTDSTVRTRFGVTETEHRLTTKFFNYDCDSDNRTLRMSDTE